ncbi:MAG: DNA recombination protein RmuC [Clostridia bacterium]|nr:DNA recombination protein RmuC [Clostridia bacterium]
MEYVILALSVLCLIGITVLVLASRKNQSVSSITQEEVKRIVREETDKQSAEIRNTVENSNLRLAQSVVTSFTETNRLVIQNIERLISDVNKNSEKTAEIINSNLEKINKSVNEQLAENLQTRLDSSYKKINDSIENISKWLGEMKELSSGVSDLKKVLTGVKTRGEWGEASLDAILEQVLTVDQYKKQVTISGQNLVDFAVILPGKGAGEKVLLPIDAKFPSEDYQRLCECSESGDVQGMEVARKALSARVKHEAVEIKNKYIKVPKTTDFAVMFVPTEGLFAEILRIAGLTDELAKQKVVLAGPTTITALLNSLRMGFKTLAIEKRSTEIGKLLASFQKDFTMYSKDLETTVNRLDGARDKLGDVVKRNTKIQEKLSKIEVLPGEDEGFGEITGEVQ